MAGIELEGVSHTYPGGVRAIDRLDLEVRKGELLVLAGPSGSGKTTLLRIIAGLERPRAGSVRLAGRDVTHLPPKDRNIAMVFQNHALYPHLTVFQNMAFGLRLRRQAGWIGAAWRRLLRRDPPATRAARREKARREKIDRRVRQVADELAITGLLDRMPAGLSGGEQQRVALGRAMVRRPEAFLFDEPLSNLDPPARIQLRNEIKRLHRQSEAPMLYVTHDQVEAMSLGDRIAVMRGGALQQVDAPRTIHDRPANRFVAGFVGAPPMNFAEGRLTASHGELQFQAPGLSVPVDRDHVQTLQQYQNRSIVLGIRPRDVRLGPFRATADRRPDKGRPDEGPSTDAAAISVSVVDVESVGDAAWGHFRLGDDGTTWLGGPPTGSTQGEDDRALAVLDMRRAYWFDAATGGNLRVVTT